MQEFHSQGAMFSRQVSWYTPELDKNAILPDMFLLLSRYSKIPESEISAHVKNIRDKSWHTFPFPCVGQFMFLRLRLSTYSFYPHLLSYLKRPEKPLFLDLGACLGQEVRKLAFDGVPTSQLFMADRFLGYKECGEELFRDTDMLGNKYMLFDVFESGCQGLGEKGLDGKFNVVALLNVLHLFDLSSQKWICCRIARQVLRQEKGVVVLGSQMAAESSGREVKLPNLDGNEGEEAGQDGQEQIAHDKKAFDMMAKMLMPREKNVLPDTPKRKEVFAHDVASFESLWADVGKECGVKFKVDAHIVPMENEGLGTWVNDSNWLVFWVERM